MPTSGDNTHVPHAQVIIDGTPLTDTLANAMESIEVDTALGMSDVAVIRFADNGDFVVMNDTKFKAGATLSVKFEEKPVTSTPTLGVVFEGEITSVEGAFNENLRSVIIITAHDKTHRLARETKTKVFKDVTHSDVVSQLVTGTGISVEKDDTTAKFKHIFQDNVTDRDMLEMLARRNGYVTFTKAGKLQFRKNTTFATTTIALEWGKEGTLRNFRPRLTLSGQVNKVQVRGWDVAQKAAISGESATSSSHATAGIMTAFGGNLAQAAFAAATRLESRSSHPVDMGDAGKVAAGVLDRINAESMEAEGMCWGNAKIRLGVKLQITGLGSRFNGAYIPSSITHRYTSEGYYTYFRVEGLRAQTFASLLSSGNGKNDSEIVHAGEKWAGVYPAVVTKNAKDGADANSGYGSVTVKFPWLAEDKESYWARVAAPGAGNARGMLWLPEVGDEVLVAFEGGDFNHPYVLGGLWNGQDALPEGIDTVATGGKIEIRTFKTRIGHIIRLTDTSGGEKIEIIDGKGKFDLTMDSANEKITLHCTKDIDIKADGAGKVNVTSASGPISVKTTGNVDVDAGSGNLTMKGTNVTIEATAAMKVKGATVGVEGSGITQVKGSMVQIN